MLAPVVDSFYWKASLSPPLFNINKQSLINYKAPGSKKLLGQENKKTGAKHHPRRGNLS
jgi:hypothetical protein